MNSRAILGNNRPFQRKRKYAWNARTRGARHIRSAIEAPPAYMSHTFLWRKAQHYVYAGRALRAVLPGIPILLISLKSTIFPSPRASCRVF